MTLDELQSKWAQQEASFQSNLHLNRNILRGLTIERARRYLQSAAFWAIAGLLLAVPWLWWLGSFVYSHLDEPRFWIPGAILHLYTIALLSSTIRVITAQLSVDFSLPVAMIQEQIASIRRTKMRLSQFVLYTAALIWVPTAIVGIRGMLGFNPYGNPRWIMWNIVFGVILIPVLHAAARAAAARAEEPGFVRDFLRDAGGYHLRRAAEVIAELEEKEPH